MNSVLDIIFTQLKQRQDDPALHYLENGEFFPITFKEMGIKAEKLSSFIKLHANSGEKVVIWSNNCWQWAVSDLACQLADVVSVPIYPTAGIDQLDYIFNDSQPVVVFVDNLTKDRLELLRSFECIKKIVYFFSTYGMPTYTI